MLDGICPTVWQQTVECHMESALLYDNKPWNIMWNLSYCLTANLGRLYGICPTVQQQTLEYYMESLLLYDSKPWNVIWNLPYCMTAIPLDLHTASNALKKSYSSWTYTWADFFVNRPIFTDVAPYNLSTFFISTSHILICSLFVTSILMILLLVALMFRATVLATQLEFSVFTQLSPCGCTESTTSSAKSKSSSRVRNWNTLFILTVTVV